MNKYILTNNIVSRRLSRVLSACILCGALWTPAPIFGADDFVPQQLVWRGESRIMLDSIASEFELTWIDYIPELNAYLLVTQGTVADVEELANVITVRRGVIYCEPNYILNSPEPVQQSQPFVDINGGGNFESQDASVSVSLESAHKSSIGDAISVAVIDGGINFDHPLLAGVVFSGYDYVDDDSLAFDEEGGLNSGHGTFVAGITHLAAPGAKILGYRVLDVDGSGNGFDIARAIIKATKDSCQVINLSLVMEGWHSGIADAIDYAVSKNVTVVAAAGNNNTEQVRFPASHQQTIAVAALDSLLIKADFSNYGGPIRVSAPGTEIYGPYLDTSYAYWSGTSFAAPFVSGQAALIYQAKPEANPELVGGIIRETAISVETQNPGFENKLGSGLVDAEASVLLAANLVCGDANSDSRVNISDVTYLISHIFAVGAEPQFKVLGDPNGDGTINVSDVTFLIARIFSSGPAPLCVFQ